MLVTHGLSLQRNPTNAAAALVASHKQTFGSPSVEFANALKRYGDNSWFGTKSKCNKDKYRELLRCHLTF